MMGLFAIAISAFLLQAFSEIRGASPEVLGAKGWLSQGILDKLERPYMFRDQSPEEVFNEYVSKGSASVAQVSATVSSAAEEASDVAASEASAQASMGLRELIRARDVGDDTFDAGNDGRAIVVQHYRHSVDDGGGGALSAVLHPEDTIQQHHAGAKRWEDLASHEKEAWKKRLSDASQWAVEEGETVLKGVFFSGLAGAVGAAVHAEL